MAGQQEPLSILEGRDRGYMTLPPERAGPYLRALVAGLSALAPNDDHVPLREALAHLQALDPATSGDLLTPAEIDTRSGLPGFPWMERALAEQSIARDGAGYSQTSDAEISRAVRLDPVLGDRMGARRALHKLLLDRPLLPISRLSAALKRLGKTTDFVLAYDRMTPVGAWMRIRAELSGRAGWDKHGPFSRTSDGRVTVDSGMQHLLSRHLATPLLALSAQLTEATGAQVTRLSRSFVGPFWFPGLSLPDQVPEALSKGLLLHLSTEVVARDIRNSGHRDPLVPKTIGEVVPEGYGLYRSRRFAASPGLITPVKSWAAGQGIDVVVVSLVPRA
jgi:hypothetical protein